MYVTGSLSTERGSSIHGTKQQKVQSYPASKDSQVTTTQCSQDTSKYVHTHVYMYTYIRMYVHVRSYGQLIQYTSYRAVYVSSTVTLLCMYTYTCIVIVYFYIVTTVHVALRSYCKWYSWWYVHVRTTVSRLKRGSYVRGMQFNLSVYASLCVAGTTEGVIIS